MSSVRKAIVGFFYLSSPVWGLVLLLYLLSLLPDASRTPGEPIVFIGMLAPFIGAVPIYRMSGQSLVFRTVTFLFYYAACAVVMFVVGWASLGAFGIAK
jgi:hypothetical protein